MESIAALGVATTVVQMIANISQILSFATEIHYTADLDAMTNILDLSEVMDRYIGIESIGKDSPESQALLAEASETIHMVQQYLLETYRNSGKHTLISTHVRSWVANLPIVGQRRRILEPALSRLQRLEAKLDLAWVEHASFQALESMTDNPGIDPYSRSGICALVQQLRNTNDKSYGLACGQLINRTAWPDIGRQNEDDFRQQTASILLRFLAYEAMSTRHSEIQAPSARAAFNWVFDTESQLPLKFNYDSLSWWLSHGSGLYWVSGKEAAGKSTLMKYIRNHHKTRKCLEEWADHTPLATAAFLCWRSGSPLENSQEGLLRSLLYTILTKHSDLLPIVLPREWAIIYCRVSGYGPTESEVGAWRLSELRKSFSRLIRQEQYPLKLFFLVDGLDEYEGGDISDILQLFSDTSHAKNVKALVSSRPHECPPFDGVESLVLHELNHKDMRTYIYDQLGLPAGPPSGPFTDSSDFEELVSHLIKTSDGSFLWVVLVLRIAQQKNLPTASPRQLLIEIRNHPAPPLERIYKRLWDTIPMSHKPQASRMLQMMRTSRSIRQPLRDGADDVEPLTLVDLAFGEGLPRETIHLAVEPWDEGKILGRCNEIAKGFTQKWPGFIEISDSGQARHKAPIPIPSSPIRYCHRFTMEYLNRAEICTLLENVTDSPRFFPYLAHLKSAVHRLKILPLSTSANDLVYRWEFVSLAFASASQIEAAGEQGLASYFNLMAELDKTMHHHHQRLQKNADGSWIERYLQDFNGKFERGDGGRQSKRLASIHWCSFYPGHENEPVDLKQRHPQKCKDTFLTLAIQFGLIKYLRSSLRKQNLVRAKEGRPLLSYVLDPSAVSRYELIKPNIVEVLLEHGADPEELFEGKTCWEDALRWQYETFVVHRGRRSWSSEEVRQVAELRLQIFLLLINQGVNTTAVAETSKGSIPAENVLTASFKPWTSEESFETLMRAFQDQKEKSSSRFTWSKSMRTLRNRLG